MPPASRQPRARPVADAPVAALVSGAETLARDWLVELVGAAPLEEVGALPLDAVARTGPALFAGVARALSSDRDLARLEPGGDLRAVAGVAAAGTPAATLSAVEALRRVAWAGAMAEAPRAPAAMVADLADRLALVCSELAAAALEAAGPAPDRLASLAAREHRLEAEAAAPPAPPPPPGEPPRADAHAAPEPWAGEDSPRVVAGPGDGPAAPIVRPPVADAAEAEPALSPRVADGDPRTHLAARTADFLADGRPFAVLLVELDGIDAILADDGAGALAVEAAEAALEDLVRPGDAIRREAAGRLWLTLPGAGPAGARALALRAAAAVERAAGHRGAPLTASVGLAVCPRDGSDPDDLAEIAESGLLEARAAGTHGAEPAAD